MVVIKSYRSYLIVRQGREYGFIDSFIGMVGHWYKKIAEVIEEIDLIEGA
jgi:hypothetical protein